MCLAFNLAQAAKRKHKMDQASITTWLERKIRRDRMIGWFGGLGTLAAGALLLMLAWGVVYIVSLFTAGPWLGYRHWIHSVLGWVALPLLFWGNARTSREYLSEYSVTASGSGEVVSFYLPGVGLVSNVNPLAPETISAGAKLITDILYTAPRVVVAAFRMMRKAARLRHIDVWNCGAVLTLLFAAGKKMSFQEIADGLGEGFDPVFIFPQMALIEGVLFLKAEPAGLTLTQETRDTIRQEARAHEQIAA